MGVIKRNGVSYSGSGGGTIIPTWNEIIGKPETFPPSAHNHDDLYYGKDKVYTKNETDIKAAELQVLGWTTPNECPIQNEFVNGVLTQKVGRVDLGNCNYTYDGSGPRFLMGDIANQIKRAYAFDFVYIEGYVGNKTPIEGTKIDKSICVFTNGYVYLTNFAYTDATTFKSAMSGKYLYYELAAPVQHSITNDVGLVHNTTNLLKPTLQTTTVSGVTFTNNGDGTYTLNGTASSTILLEIYKTSDTDRNYRLVGTPNNGEGARLLAVQSGSNIIDYGSGAIIPKGYWRDIRFYIPSGAVCNNLVFKPMLTTDLNATYDDFVPYTGDTGTIQGDLAQVTTELEDIEFLGWSVPGESPIKNVKDGNGNFHKRVGRVDLGSLNWTKYSDTHIFYADVSNRKAGSQNGFLNDYPYESRTTSTTAWTNLSNGKITYNIATNRIYIRNDSYSDALTFASVVSGKYLYYELAIEEVIPCGSESNNAVVSDEWDSTTAYVIGDYVIYLNALYKCLVANTNVVPTNTTYWKKCTLSEELGTLTCNISNLTGGTVNRQTVFKRGPIVMVNMEFTITSTIAAWTKIGEIADYRLCPRKTSIVRALITDPYSSTVYPVTINDSGAILLGGIALPSGTYYITTSYISIY